ncbi:MAG: hypothetical protein Ct9H90mP6_11150 [Gammaproteobacteria bacterium]|nr:MAG: hypothetical protein Ct9H90mP6_11150 [Gammaproteobacteria bacterium]
MRFFWEKVKNLLSHDKGQTLKLFLMFKKKTWLQSSIPFNKAKSYVPQNRQRIYIVGFREENNFNFDDLIIPDISKGPTLSSVLHPEEGSENFEEPYTIPDLAKVNEKYTITDKLGEISSDVRKET